MKTRSVSSPFFQASFQAAFWGGMATLLCGLALTLAAGRALATDAPAKPMATPAATLPVTTAPPVAVEEPPPVSSAKEMGNKIREALGVNTKPNGKLTLVINGKPVATGSTANPGVVAGSGSHPVAAATAARKTMSPTPVSAPKIAMADNTHGADVHWSYEGENGPQTWGKLKPEFNLCALGKRQSPINIEEGSTLVGPAEPLQFSYTPSNGTVVNNGHTIQVDVQGENTITVRGSSYRLLQFHFHTPSEEQINFKRTAMVAHLVHKNDEGQLAVVAVLLQAGAANPVIDKVWTYMPLDAGDRVRMPKDLLNLNEILPTDQRYYQFMGSLTTPPCTEGVLWLVLKQPVQISKAQYRLFTQLYPNNARPVQALNSRSVRDAQ